MSSSKRVVQLRVGYQTASTRPWKTLCDEDMIAPGGGGGRGAGVGGYFGHSLTKVGLALVQFGGYQIAPDGTLTPTNHLWVRESVVSGWQRVLISGATADAGGNFEEPAPRYGHVATGTGEGHLLVLGGHSGRRYLRDVWVIKLFDVAVTVRGGGMHQRQDS